jgi:sRNA-binding regulator protein Hfq
MNLDAYCFGIYLILNITPFIIILSQASTNNIGKMVYKHKIDVIRLMKNIFMISRLKIIFL